MADEISVEADGKTIKLHVLDPGDMLDVLEAAGDQSGNAGWIQYALTICSVTEIDGVPAPRPRTKEEVKSLGRRLGNTAYVAAMNALFGATPPADAARETAKN